MPGGKQKLLGLFTKGLKIGGGATSGTHLKHVLAGSISLDVASIGAVQASTTCVVGTITGLTASHHLVALEQFDTLNASALLSAAKAGVGQASFMWTYAAGSGGGDAAEHTATVLYFAFRT